MFIHKIFANISTRQSIGWTIGAFLAIPLVGALDRFTGQEVLLSPLYFVPVAYIAWTSSNPVTLIGVMLSAIIWAVADSPSLAGHGVSILVWNVAVRLIELVFVAIVLESLKRSFARERELSRLDGLTGALNARAFQEVLLTELHRANRHQSLLTLAYIDVDHFKTVNDTFGHHAGDELLTLIAVTICQTLRINDSLARLGGDEFALLLPETDTKTAKVVIERVYAQLCDVVHSGRITFSIGVLTCTATPEASMQLLETADRLMYSVKRGGRNGIKYAVYPPMDDLLSQEQLDEQNGRPTSAQVR